MMKLFILLLLSTQVLAKPQISTKRLNKLSGSKKESFDSKSDWDNKYNRSSFIFGKRPAKFLAENYDFLPPESNVLDVGMGEGRNAVFLAQKGHKVTGVDISSVAIKKAYILAKEYGVRIKGVVASMETYNIPDNFFDAIVCFYYVDRNIISKMINWLRPGGILIFEAYTLKQRQAKGLKRESESFFVKPQELLTMFPGMQVLKFEEPEHEKNFRSSIILKKN